MRRVDGHLLLIGRHEHPDNIRERRLFEAAQRIARRADQLYRWRWQGGGDPDRLWDRWQVQALIGPVGDWTESMYLAYDGFGVDPLPVMVGGLRYLFAADIIDPFTPSRIDPPVLLRSWELMPHDGVPDAPGSPTVRKSNAARLRNLGRQLDQHRLLDHPFAATKLGWEQLLQVRRLKIGEDSRGRPAVVPA